ncbi:MAG TPA: efflux RND transporter permease subunit [Candidatus Paceibacterota bacterium]|nr:efflux RND transporter permease subunit [Candidatus Paceibacterota bacterium]
MLPLWNFFLEKRQFSYVLVGTLIAAGLYSLAQIPKENTPQINIPYATVVTTLPGASAADMETLVTDKIEDQVSNISNVDKLTSNSSDGVSSVVVQFAASANSITSMQDLRDAAARAISDLPADASTPQVTKISFNDSPILVASVSGNLSPNELSDLGKSLSDDLKSISGVSRVDVAGVPSKEVDVIVSKEALSQYGLRLTDVISAISASNAALPAGSITMDNVNYTVNFKGGITDPNDIANIAVGIKGGAPIYLHDIARIDNGLAPATTYSRVSENGAPSQNAITLSVYKQSGASIVGTAQAVEKKFDDEKNGQLKGLNVLISPSTDQGKEVGKQLGDLTKTGIETVMLVILALLLTIGWRESLVAALSIPLSFLIAFIGLYATGNTLNFISLFALILAVGILVDSGIVVTEAIHARTKLYKTKMEAARAALHDYAWPLIAGTMATVAVFAPLFFITGIIGEFIAGIPYTLIFVLIASIFVALGMVPLIAILFTKEQPNALEKKQEEYTHRVTLWYKAKLRTALESKRFQKIFLRTLAVLFVISLILPVTGLVQSVFFPQDDQDFVFINISKPQGTTLQETDLATREVEELLYSDKDIASFETTVGQSSSFGGGGGSGGGSSGSNQASITVNLPDGHKKTSTEMVSELQKLLAPVTDANVQVLQGNNGPSSGAPIQIQFTGDNLDDLIATADKAKQVLETVPHVTNISATTESNGNEFDLTIDRAKATALGLNTMTVAQTLRAAINGTKATTINLPLQDIPVMVKLNLNPSFTSAADTAQTTIDAVENISIQGQNGPVLLGSILNSNLGLSNAAISHQDKKRIETVSAYNDDKITSGQAITAFQKAFANVDVPAGVTISYGGENQDINTSFTQMFIALLAGLVLMFMILIIAFNSFRYTFYLLMIVPLSLIGVLDGLALTGQPLSFPSMLGFIALGGVIINHAIILMDSMIKHLHETPDTPIIDIVVESAAVRLRPIFLTTVTTVIGMIPLVAANATWAPLALSVMFGLSFAIVLTLVLVPVLFFRAPHHVEQKL